MFDPLVNSVSIMRLPFDYITTLPDLKVSINSPVDFELSPYNRSANIQISIQNLSTALAKDVILEFETSSNPLIRENLNLGDLEPGGLIEQEIEISNLVIGQLEYTIDVRCERNDANPADNFISSFIQSTKPEYPLSTTLLSHSIDVIANQDGSILYAAVSSPESAHSGEVLILSSATQETISSIIVPGKPGKLELTGDGNTLLILSQDYNLYSVDLTSQSPMLGAYLEEDVTKSMKVFDFSVVSEEEETVVLLTQKELFSLYVNLCG